MRDFLIRLVINAVALWLTAYLLPGIRFLGEGESLSIANILIVALVFGLVNSLIKPFLALLTCPFYIITLGLFTFIMNAFMLQFTGWLVGPIFRVDGFWWALAGSIIISLISIVLSTLLGESPKQPQVEVRHYRSRQE